MSSDQEPMGSRPRLPSRSISENEAIARAQAAAAEPVIGEWLGAHEVTGRQRVHRPCGCYVDDTLLAEHAKVCSARPRREKLIK